MSVQGWWATHFSTTTFKTRQHGVAQSGPTASHLHCRKRGPSPTPPPPLLPPPRRRFLLRRRPVRLQCCWCLTGSRWGQRSLSMATSLATPPTSIGVGCIRSYHRTWISEKVRTIAFTAFVQHLFLFVCLFLPSFSLSSSVAFRCRVTIPR